MALLIGALSLFGGTALSAAVPPTPQELGPTLHSPAASWDYLAKARAAMAEGKPKQARDEYRAAVDRDPRSLGAWSGLILLGLRGESPLIVEGLSGASRALRGSWENQRRLLALLIPVVWGATILACGLTLGTLGIRRLRQTRHMLVEAFQPHLGPRRAGLTASLLCLTPLGIYWGLAGAAVVYASLAWPHMTRRELKIGLLAVFAFLLCPLAERFVGLAVAPIDPSGLPYLIERVQREEVTPELKLTVREAVASRTEPEARFLQGLVHVRIGERHEAALAFEEVSAHRGPSAAPARLNRGNLHIMAGDPLAAAKLYERVLDDPEIRVEARYNLAVALSRLHRFAEADDQLAEASRLDFDRVASAVRSSSEGAGTELMEGQIKSADLWKIPGGTKTLRAPYPSLLGWWFPAGRSSAAPAVILLAIAIGISVQMGLRRRLRVYECQHCGDPVCRRCVRRTARHAYCPACAARIGSLSQSDYRLALLHRVLGVDEHERKRRALAWAVSLLPGLGMIARGRTAGGLAMTWLLCALGFTAARSMWPFDPSFAWRETETLIRSVATILFFAGWVASIAWALRTSRPHGVLRYIERDVYRLAA